MQAQNLVPFPSRLESLESEALSHWQKALEEIQKFLDAVQALKDSDLWKAKAKNWHDYCRDYMPVGATRIRQLKAAFPMQVLVEAITDVTLTENQVRLLKQKIYEVIPDEDKDLVLHTWQLAYEASGKIDPDKDILRASYEVVKKESETHKFEYNGQVYDMRQLVHEVEIKRQLVEHKEFLNERISANYPIQQKLTVDVNAALLEAIPELPKTMLGKQVTLLWRKDSEDA